MQGVFDFLFHYVIYIMKLTLNYSSPKISTPYPADTGSIFVYTICILQAHMQEPSSLTQTESILWNIHFHIRPLFHIAQQQ